MFQTVRNVSLAGARSVPMTAPELEFIFEGFDLTDATFRLEVRDRRNGGQLRAGLDTVTTSAAEGVQLLSVDTADGVTTSIVHARINETTMEAMPESDPGEDETIWWGLHITPSGGVKFEAFEGPFTIKASAVE